MTQFQNPEFEPPQGPQPCDRYEFSAIGNLEISDLFRFSRFEFGKRVDLRRFLTSSSGIPTVIVL